MTEATGAVKAVGKSESVARSHLVNFMLAVTVEGCPLEERKIAIRGTLIPVERELLTRVADCELTAFVIDRQAHHEASDMVFASWGVNVSFELAAWRGVDVELVQLRLYKGQLRMPAQEFFEKYLDAALVFVITRRRQ